MDATTSKDMVASTKAETCVKRWKDFSVVRAEHNKKTTKSWNIELELLQKEADLHVMDLKECVCSAHDGSLYCFDDGSILRWNKQGTPTADMVSGTEFIAISNTRGACWNNGVWSVYVNLVAEQLPPYLKWDDEAYAQICQNAREPEFLSKNTAKTIAAYVFQCRLRGDAPLPGIFPCKNKYLHGRIASCLRSLERPLDDMEPF